MARKMAGVLALAALVGAAPADAAKPDLVVRAVSVTPGASLTIADTTANAGRKRAKRSVTRFYLSTDPKRNAGDVRLPGARKVAALKPRKASKGTITAAVPALAAGSMFVLACADDLRKVRESKESNNCRATAAPVTLGAPALGYPAAPPAGAAATPAPTAPAPRPTPSPTPTPTPSPEPGDPEPPALPASVVTQVAGAVDASTLTEGLQPTRTVLGAAGVGLSNATDGPPPAAPASGIVVSPNQLLQIAIDASERARSSRVTFAEFAETMAALGVAFDLERGDAPDTSPALAMRDWLNQAVLAALAHPEEEISVPLLQLTALARRQHPPVELTDPQFDPHALNLGSLDVVLLSSVIGQMVAGARADMPVPAQGAQTRSMAAAEEPTDACSWVRTTLETHIPFAGDVFGYASGKVAGAGLETIYEAFGRVIFGADEGDSKEATGKGLAVLGIMFKIQALAMLYDSVDLKLTPSVADIDKPDPGITTLPTFSVLADGGIRDQDWAAFKENRLDSDLAKLRDCATEAGLPLPSSLAELGGQIEQWRIGWNVGGGSIQLAAGEADTMDFPGLRTEFLVKADDHSGTESASFEVLNAQEPMGTGPYKYEEAVVRGDLQTDGPLALSTLVSAADSQADPWALSGAIADIAAGWFRNMRTIGQTASVSLRYQDSANLEWTGTLEVRYNEIVRWNRAGYHYDDPGRKFIDQHNARTAVTYRGTLGKPSTPDSYKVGIRWSATGEYEMTGYDEEWLTLVDKCPQYDKWRTERKAKGGRSSVASLDKPQPRASGEMEWEALYLPGLQPTGRFSVAGKHRQYDFGTDTCGDWETSREGDIYDMNTPDPFQFDPKQLGADNRWRGRVEVVNNRSDEEYADTISVESTTYIWDLQRKPKP